MPNLIGDLKLLQKMSHSTQEKKTEIEYNPCPCLQVTITCKNNAPDIHFTFH